jgi:hypothetical protein
MGCNAPDGAFDRRRKLRFRSALEFEEPSVMVKSTAKAEKTINGARRGLNPGEYLIFNPFRPLEPQKVHAAEKEFRLLSLCQ